MPVIPGLLAMPTVLANALLSFVPDRSLPVRGSDRVAVASPMFNEAASAGAALDSLLRQSEPPDELAVSVNGGTDDTGAVVRAKLTEHGFTRVYSGPAADFGGSVQRWYREAGPAVVILEHAQPISKADSINLITGGRYVSSERVLVVDGDTIFAPTFLERLKDEFYRLRREKHQGRWRYVIEDSALQSGAVMSLPAEGPVASHISRARSGEYAVAALLRSGQTARVGRSAMLGNSRLYTVVGCGFVARRSSFPMPADTLTEDHDFTLQVQNGETTEERLTVADLRSRGFKLRTAEGLVDFSESLDAQDQIVLRRGPTARFVPGAQMYTEDPVSVPGYMRQVERWNGGGVENAVKRLRGAGEGAGTRNGQGRKGLRANVSFAAFSAQFENLFGIALVLLLLPVALGISTALPGYGTALTGLGAWVGFDLIVTIMLVALGFRRLARSRGERGWRLVRTTLGGVFRSAVPLLTLRPFNVVAYVVGFTRVAPKAFGPREVDPRVTITWERPRAVASQAVGRRVAAVSTVLTLSAVSFFMGAVLVANAVRPGYKETWQLIHAAPALVAEEFVDLPVVPVLRMVEPGELSADLAGELAGGAGDLELSSHHRRADGAPGGEPVTGAGPAPEEESTTGAPVGGELGEADSRHLSAYCSVGFTATPAAERRLLSGDAALYQPLTYWQRLVLARLVPLAAHLEEAATAYDVPPRLLLQVLINESYLDPLAVGPTEDLGLSQVTGDALTLLRSISTDPRSRFANPRMFAERFSVFDPDFSICAGAAKLAWARAQPKGEDDRYAYARYINPLEGVQRAGLNPVHAELVTALDGLVETVDALRHAFAAYHQDPSALTDQERALLDVYSLVKAGELGLGPAYLMTGTLIESFGIDDGDFYSDITEKLYDMGNNTVSLPAVR